MYEPWPERTYPPTWRVILAFVLAPGVAALMMAIAMPAFQGLSSWSERVWRTAQITSIVAAYPPTLVLGIPAYFMLRRHLSVRPVACAAVGFVVAALPWLFLLLAATGAGEASVDGQATVIHGRTTAYGWLLHAQSILTIGFFGAIGGFTFWAIAAAGFEPKAQTSDEETGD